MGRGWRVWMIGQLHGAGVGKRPGWGIHSRSKIRIDLLRGHREPWWAPGLSKSWCWALFLHTAMWWWQRWHHRPSLPGWDAQPLSSPAPWPLVGDRPHECQLVLIVRSFVCHVATCPPGARLRPLAACNEQLSASSHAHTRVPRAASEHASRWRRTDLVPGKDLCHPHHVWGVTYILRE